MTLKQKESKPARQEEVQMCRDVGVWEPVLRKDMEADGCKAVSLRWIDTNKSDAGRPTLQVSSGRERDQEGHQEI